MFQIAQFTAVERQLTIINSRGDTLSFNELTPCLRPNGETWLIERDYGVVMTTSLAKKIVYNESEAKLNDLLVGGERTKLALYHLLRQQKAPMVSFFQFVTRITDTHPLRKWADGILKQYAAHLQLDPHKEYYDQNQTTAAYRDY